MYLCVDYSNKYEIYFSKPRSWVLWAIIDLHEYVCYYLIIVLIIVLVFAVVCLLIQQKTLNKNIKENIKFINDYTRNKLETFCHAPKIEYFWTIVPLIMLAFMGWPSFRTLYSIEEAIDPFHTLVVIGNQWYRTYYYSDFDVISCLILELDSKKKIEQFKKHAFSSYESNLSNLVLSEEIAEKWNDREFFQYLAKHLRDFEEAKIMYDCVIIAEESLPKGYPRLLSTDSVVVLPAHAAIRILITSNDVIHSWAVPSHGIKSDAIPGRINQVNFLTSFWGTYWGQCSELCGINHGFMPIEMKVIPLLDYISFLRLNISFRLDKFIPLIQIYTNSYLINLKNKIIEDKFAHVFDVK